MLAQNPEIQERLRNEVQHLQDPTFEQIESCRYLNNVCREILRYTPPGQRFLIYSNGSECDNTSRQCKGSN
jgi:cytochrome P450